MRYTKMWALILGSALNTLGLFITIPIINIYAVDAFHLSAVQIGFISGIWPGTVFCMSFLLECWHSVEGTWILFVGELL